MKTPDFNINDPISTTKDVPCPSCAAKVGESCKNAIGGAKGGYHTPRLQLFNRTKQYQDGTKR